MNNFYNTNQKINELIEKKYFTGAVLKVAKHGEIIFENEYGINDVDKNTKMKDNLIFRAYSMTKPVTVVAALILVDRKIININDKVSKYLPEFENVLVLKEQNSKETENTKKDLRIWNLLTMTSGITYAGNKNDTQLQTSFLLKEFHKKNNGKYMNYETFIKLLSKIPLSFNPGENWRYGLSIDVLAAIIEKVSNKNFRDFVKEEIFDKLEMNDSDFYLKDKNREACVYNWTLNENDQVELTKVENFNFFIQDYEKVPPMPMGGAGLFTTAKDYLNFLNFLIDGKDKKQNQLLSMNLIRDMSSNQLGDLKKNFIWTLNEDYSYGYGVRVRIKNNLYPKTELGEFGWDGLLGSTGLVDPKNGITMCLMLSSKPGHNKLIESEFFEALYNDLNI
ncbi:serine hydrolase domain-containing protein [Spiroplasma taiwanense]|uniref:Transmembrane protein n=1 Tax=Spiroplasma taiwanense CT-1 TaxID=1276220 RepID=S5MAL0_9MOLU|nr:serine hydrolase domain-containing protein [Spiroplasma taiwanense]AGR40793.1 transmembrane protein [Spiroplasma taiwanense CT-1]